MVEPLVIENEGKCRADVFPLKPLSKTPNPCINHKMGHDKSKVHAKRTISDLRLPAERTYASQKALIFHHGHQHANFKCDENHGNNGLTTCLGTVLGASEVHENKILETMSQSVPHNCALDTIKHERRKKKKPTDISKQEICKIPGALPLMRSTLLTANASTVPRATTI